MAKLKAGNKFVFNDCKTNRNLIKENRLQSEFKIGKIYNVEDDGGELCFRDDEGDFRAVDLWASNSNSVSTKVTKIRN